MTIEESLLGVWSCCSWLFSVVWRFFCIRISWKKICWLLSCNPEDLQTLLNCRRLESMAHQSSSDDLGVRIQQTKLLHSFNFFTLILRGQTPPSIGTTRRQMDIKLKIPQDIWQDSSCVGLVTFVYGQKIPLIDQKTFAQVFPIHGTSYFLTCKTKMKTIFEIRLFFFLWLLPLFSDLSFMVSTPVQWSWQALKRRPC